MANQKPVAEVRIGRVKATIWPNGTEEQPRHNVTFSRLYKDDAGEWKTTQSFGRNDLLCLPKWPIRSTRASSSFLRKKNSRPSPRGRGFRERRGWSSPFSDPSRFAPNPTSRLANCPPECGVPYLLRLSASPPSGLGNECRVKLGMKACWYMNDNILYHA